MFKAYRGEQLNVAEMSLIYKFSKIKKIFVFVIFLQSKVYDANILWIKSKDYPAFL